MASPIFRRNRGLAVAAVLALGLLPACSGQRPGPAPFDGTKGVGKNTNSTVTVRANDARVTRVEEMIQGRVAGVQVLRTANGGFALRIRGVSSIYGSNEPLYVVDGVPVRVGPGSGLSWLNPGDIARIEVLKDPSDLALYGVQGANGVVLITTRRGG